MMNPKVLKIVMFAVWVMLFGGVLLFLRSRGIPASMIPEYIQAWVQSLGFWGPLAYISLYALRTLTFFSATAFTLISGAIFGPFWGIVYTIVGENLAANLAFVVGKYFGKDVIVKAGDQLSFFPKGEKLRENSFISVLLMRLLFFPFDWVGYLSGAYNLKQREFALATFIGILPGLIAFVALGDIFANPLRSLAIFTPFFLFGLGVAYYLKKHTKTGQEFQRIKEEGSSTVK